MYESFFGLACEAFSVAPDPRFLYLSPKHRDALAHLNYGLRRGGGFVLLTGEIGAGKTTVWRRFLEQLPENCDVAYVGNPKLGIDALLARILDDLRVEPPEEGRITDPIDALHGHLLLAHAAGRRALIVVDEAQALAPDVLEQLRLLTNLVVSADRKLLQVLLIGQPELRAMLQEPALEPVSQRVVARYHLPALAREETAAYIAHRLAVAGLEGTMPFDDEALRRIHTLCHGVPRRINVLCDRALLCAQQAGRRSVDGEMAAQAAREVFDEGVAQRNAAPAPEPAPQAAAAPAVPHLPAVQPWQAGQGTRATQAFIAGGVIAAAALVTGLWLGGRTGWTPSPATASHSAAQTSEGQNTTLARAGAPGPNPQAVTSPPVAAAPAIEGGVAATPAVVERPGFAARPATLQVPAATAATNTAQAPAGVVAGPPKAPAELDALFTPDARSEAGAWRDLAQLWGVTLPGGDPCAVAPQRSLRCYQAVGWLGPVRLLQRPGLLTLADAQGRIAHVLLLGLDSQRARLRAGSVERDVPLAQLEQAWRGDFATFWRTPPGYRRGDLTPDDGPFASWLADRLPQAAAAASGAVPGGLQGLSARVFAFQLAHGLPPDGLPGPLTVMQINRASGVDEPKLQALR